MATAPTMTNAESSVRIRHPLARLRGTIRRYVTIEGVLAVGLVLAIWIWLSLALDLGSFKLLAFDWVQELPRWFRGLMLTIAIAGVMAVAIVKLVRRLTVDFRPSALALVLEQHYPDELGDRLITAVELADLDRAEQQGYSRAMVAETVREAGDRVEQVAIEQVFDWKRLRRMASWFTGISLLPLVLFGIGYTVIRQTNPLSDYLPRFRDVAATWARRNVLLQDVIWPRRAYIDVLDFPASGELRIGRDAPAPRLRFKARRWVIADSTAREGWRSLTWSDLRPNWLGRDVPNLPTQILSRKTPAAALVAGLIAAPTLIPAPLEQQSGDDIQNWTLDQLEIALEDDATQQRLQSHSPDMLSTINNVFELLGHAVTRSDLRGVIRRLEVPDRVEVKYWGMETSSRLEILRGPGWEYTGTPGDLKESVKFRARGADYDTTTRQITLVPPPTIQQLKRIELRPAYLYHRPPLGNPPEGGPLALRGLRQRIEDFVSLNGPTSRISAPFGTQLTLDGQMDKELTQAVLKPRSASISAQPIQLSSDHQGFQHQFERITGPLEFDLEFTDTDGVKSTRHFIIDAIPDQAPLVNVIIDGIRKNAQGNYLVTPQAMIPFDGKVIDGVGGQPGGLDRIEYVLTMTRLESSLIANTQAEWITSNIFPLIGGHETVVLSNSLALAEVNRIVLANSPANVERVFPLESFQQVYGERATGDVIRNQLISRLANEPGPSALIREFVLQPRFEYLDLEKRMPELKVRSESEVQPRYRVKLTVMATDNNVETGPGVSTNKEPPFTVLVVSEAELLVEIAREEENLHLKTEDAVQRLREARQKLEKVGEDLPTAPNDQLPTFAQRSQEIGESTVKSRDIIQEVFGDYSRIARELELNRVAKKIIEKVKLEICIPLESALKVEFIQTEEALESYRKELEGSRRPDLATTTQCKRHLDRLIEKLEQVLGAMGDVTTINKLITALREIEKGQEQSIGSQLKELQRLQREKLIRDLEKLKGLEDK